MIVLSYVMKVINMYVLVICNSIIFVYLRSLLKKKVKGFWKVMNMLREKKFKLFEFFLVDRNL